MQVPLEWSHRGLNGREAELAESLVRRLVDKLQQYAPNLVSCRVAVERNQATTRHGAPFRVRIEANLPLGHTLISTRDNAVVHEEMEPMIRHAFSALVRQVKETNRRRRGDVKHREAGDNDIAFVVRLFPEENYGFLKTPEGLEIYVHRNAVLHGEFDQLTIGTQVRFVATLGDKGLQATSVQIVDKPGVAARTRRAEVNPDLPAGWER